MRINTKQIETTQAFNGKNNKIEKRYSYISMKELRNLGKFKKIEMWLRLSYENLMKKIINY